MRRTLILIACMVASLFAAAQTLSVSQAGSGNTATVAVTLSGQIKWQWSAADNWGLDGWWDLVNDASATTNLASPVYSVGGSAVPCAEESGLAQYTFYSEGDEKESMHWVANGCTYSATTRTMNILVNTSSLVVLEVVSTPVITSGPSAKLTTVKKYYINTSGQIKVSNHITTNASITLGSGAWGDDFAIMMGLPNSLQTGSTPPDTQSVGWVRAAASANPYNFNASNETYLYAYWGSSSGAFGYGSSMTPKASIMIVPSPRNVVTGLRQGIHSWACGTGCGVTRWGYLTQSGQSLAAGQSVDYEWLIQFGTQGSGVLPNMTITPPTTCAICTTIANAYTASPSPSAGLLTGVTPNTLVTPSGWTNYATQDFESGTFGSGAYGNGNFVTTQAHPDGNGAHTHSIECQVGGTPDCSGNVSWNKPLAVGTRELYVSFYEWLDNSFRMNDEMFLMRLWWNTGTGQPSNREAVLDYFQNSNLQYNSTNATMLWNIQFAPGNYYQNKLPGNVIGDGTNFQFYTGQWVQHEIYTKFSTTQAAVAVGGNLTLNTTAKTYTCTACDWVALGAHVGDSPHFTGLSDNPSNGIDQSGGAYSYFITALTPTVMTVTGYAGGGWSNQTVSGATVQIDHADGAYLYYKNGSLVGYQPAMINPGYVDWATQATNLSIGESYSKLIWHAGPETSAPFSSACSSNISGIGYDNLYGGFGSAQYGWNGAGLTATTQADMNAGNFTAHIRCDATWGGPMPTPPVFKRYLDDIIVLTKTASAPPTIITPFITNGVKVSGVSIR